MTVFRPCIDLHDGKVKQIVGGTLRDGGEGPTTNFVSEKPPAWYAALYKSDNLRGGHVIRLGPGNDDAALDALAGWPGGLHLGGGVTAENAARWIDAGAEKVIVTSWLFTDDALDMARVEAMARAVGPSRLVIDLSCRRVDDGYRVATNRWQTVTDTPVDRETLARLASFCSEYLVHAADVEGRCRGIDAGLVALLGEGSPIPCTYAGGARSVDDLRIVDTRSGGRVDLTFGSALDIFGGALVKYSDCLAWNRERSPR